MNICICGWYFDDEFIRKITAWCCYPHRQGFIVAHQAPPREFHALGCEIHSNIGLEFGAYDQYLRHHWDKKSDILFIQDDTKLTDYKALQDIEALKDQPIDQAFIFNNEWEDMANRSKHGRAIWCRGSFLTRMIEDIGGFPYDRENFGENKGERANVGIQRFTDYCNRFPRAGFIAIVPGIQHGRRGVLPNESYVYHRGTRQGAKLIPGAPNGALTITAC